MKTMKKSVAFLLAASLAVSGAFSAAADSYADVQRTLQNNAPLKIPVSTVVELSGTIREVFASYTFADEYYLLVAVDEDDVMLWGPEDDNFFLAHYTAESDQLPFAPGDSITAKGKLASVYSSVVLPYIVADTIELIP